MEPIVKHRPPASAVFAWLREWWYRLVAGLALALSVLAVDTSCTAPPHCPAGQHSQRAPSHQGHMWDCVPDGGRQ
jgi:hypothetical protein